MRTWLSVVVIGFSLLALGAGYLNGSGTAAPARNVQSHTLPEVSDRIVEPVDFPRSLHGAHSFDAGEASSDALDGDPVLSDAHASSDLSREAPLTLVLAHAGESLQLESGFIELPVPMTVCVNPSGASARDVADLARQNGKTVYAELLPPPGGYTEKNVREAVASAHSTLGAFSGIAARFSDDERDDGIEFAAFARGLRGQPHAVFFIDGENETLREAARKFGFTERGRDIAIDRREEPAYVDFMLTQAVGIARARGYAAMMARPHPESLAALQRLVSRASRDGVKFTPL